ncbi:UNVERIFIED_CONTAM: Stem-specific protein TSJT1 [Sesamum radiatum]|uniref:Stem-specific protein TSJT1 n=1 Tax=Sesamum radiatum TaxID=300843 RepID=A0AAW2T0Y0_SESRA
MEIRLHLYNLSSGNFLALSHRDENPAHPRCIIVMDDIFCIFSGALYNTCDLRRHYLSRQATEAMIIIEAYKDRDGCVQLHWGTAADGSLVCTDDPNVISAACGKCYTPFPPGCIFISGNGLISFDHPLKGKRNPKRMKKETLVLLFSKWISSPDFTASPAVAVQQIGPMPP